MHHAQSGCIFDIGVRVFNGEENAFVRIEGHHTNVVAIEKNGESIADCKCVSDYECVLTDRSVLSVSGIVEFANTAAIDDIKEFIERQISFNTAISDEGLKNDYGARVGKILLKAYGDGVHNKARAAAAAGSDARMNGCNLPVVIVSGSGNQGITACVPVTVYAQKMGASHEKLIRAVALADLIT
ncbi:MAG: L-serine ammonia-lyase, iron-sulfur-dependent, subunit alpha, partial [Clostridia bacterium]|nr:L-serine ammonia-lyase, iron-sulfur-dependent, subunit alpha [Clostridia bacterium]